MGVRIGIAVVLSALFFGALWFYAQPREAGARIEKGAHQARKAVETGMKAVKARAKDLPKETRNWLRDGNGWVYAGAGGSVLIFLVCLLSGGKKRPEEKKGKGKKGGDKKP